MCQIVYVDLCLLQFGTIQGLYGDERALTFVLFYDKELIYVRFCFLYWKSYSSARVNLLINLPAKLPHHI